MNRHATYERKSTFNQMAIAAQKQSSRYKSNQNIQAHSYSTSQGAFVRTLPHTLSIELMLP